MKSLSRNDLEVGPGRVSLPYIHVLTGAHRPSSGMETCQENKAKQRKLYLLVCKANQPSKQQTMIRTNEHSIPVPRPIKHATICGLSKDGGKQAGKERLVYGSLIMLRLITGYKLGRGLIYLSVTFSKYDDDDDGDQIM